MPAALRAAALAVSICRRQGSVGPMSRGGMLSDAYCIGIPTHTHEWPTLAA